MRAMQLQKICDLSVNAEPLQLADLPVPRPGTGEVLIKVSACGVCHTEIDEIEGRTPPESLPVVPGHQVIGRVEDTGAACHRLSRGDRVGVGWIYHSDGGPSENISPHFRATGRDADGGYAEYMIVPESYACPIPDVFGDAEAAPLLCAGAIGYRSLRLCNLVDGDPLGLTGFGGSGHIVLQLVRHLYPESAVYVFARSPEQRAFALSLGADWCGDTQTCPPQAPAAIIDTTPAWAPVLAALEVLSPGGRLVINAIRKTADDRGCMADIDYAAHLWMEKEIKSVANICFADIEEFLSIAADIPIRPEVELFALEDANDAILALHNESVRGSKVLVI